MPPPATAAFLAVFDRPRFASTTIRGPIASTTLSILTTSSSIWIHRMARNFPSVVAIARALHEKLEELQLANFLKTSGATGIHIYIPVEPVYTYEQLRTFGEIIARTVTAEQPEPGDPGAHRCQASGRPSVDRRAAKCSRGDRWPLHIPCGPSLMRLFPLPCCPRKLRPSPAAGGI